MRIGETAIISIIIRCYNEEKYIGRLLSGIQAQTLDKVQIVVVDSGSTDETVAIASSYPITLVKIRPEDFSFGYSLNQGCAVAKGKFLVFASAHVYPLYKDWLERLIAPLKNEQVALCYGKQRGNETTKYSEHQIFAKWFPECDDFNQHHPFCNNANIAIRRELWQRFPYNESLTGLEDIDWAKQIMAFGYIAAYAANAEVIHVHNETPLKIFNRYRREAIALKNIYPEQQFTFWDFLRFSGSNIASDYYYAWHDKVLIRNLISIPLFRFMQFLGTFQGLRQIGSITDDMKHTFYYPRSLRREIDRPAIERVRIDYTNKPHS
jgi:glycosyltransferase involved in cell wall biosynthesis